MKLNPIAVVFWLACGLGGFLFSGGNLMIAGWAVFGALFVSTVATFFSK